MKIEVGGFYKTEDGRKVRIYAIDGRGLFPIHGAILCEDGWTSNSWILGGRNLDVGTSNMDIVDYWPEQPEESPIDSTITPSAAVRQEILQELMHFYNIDSGLDSHPLYRDRPTKAEDL